MRYADILSAVRDPATFSSNSPAVFKTTAYMPMHHDDPPRHTQLRRVVNKSLSPARVTEFGGWIGQLVGEMLDAAGPGPMELMQGFAVPKTFNHGTSAQRKTWFERGYASGNPGDCDTFSGNV